MYNSQRLFFCRCNFIRHLRSSLRMIEINRYVVTNLSVRGSASMFYYVYRAYANVERRFLRLVPAYDREVLRSRFLDGKYSVSRLGCWVKLITFRLRICLRVIWMSWSGVNVFRNKDSQQAECKM